MTNNISILVNQLRVLRKCGVSTIFAPWPHPEQFNRVEWAVKSVALLNGYDVSDFDNELWTRVLAVVGPGVLTLNHTEGFTPDERAEFDPLLASAAILLEEISGSTAELAGRTITI